jgi:hypothetical protein
MNGAKGKKKERKISISLQSLRRRRTAKRWKNFVRFFTTSDSARVKQKKKAPKRRAIDAVTSFDFIVELKINLN